MGAGPGRSAADRAGAGKPREPLHPVPHRRRGRRRTPLGFGLEFDNVMQASGPLPGTPPADDKECRHRQRWPPRPRRVRRRSASPIPSPRPRTIAMATTGTITTAMTIAWPPGRRSRPRPQVIRSRRKDEAAVGDGARSRLSGRDPYAMIAVPGTGLDRSQPLKRLTHAGTRRTTIARLLRRLKK